MCRGIVVLGMVALILCVSMTNGFCDTAKTANSNAMDLLTHMLRSKGVISAKEAAALKKKITGNESGDSIKALVKLLDHKGLISPKEANHVMEMVAEQPTEAQKAAKAILVVPRNSEYEKSITKKVVSSVQKNINEQVETDIAQEGLEGKLAASLPPWAQHFSFCGYARLRYEGDYFPTGNGSVANPSSPSTPFNTTNDRQRMLMLLQFDIQDRINDKLTVGVQLATGNTDVPVSDNDTFGNYFNKYDFLLDQAYLKFQPFCGLTIWGGRIPNPWFYTDLVWSNYLNFEGVAVDYRRQVLPHLTGFLTAGGFPLQEIEISQHDKYLVGGQTGLTYQPVDRLAFKLGVALYDYENITGVSNPVNNPDIYDYTAPLYMQKGNTVFNINQSSGSTALYALAAQFRELDILGSVDLAVWEPIHVVLTGDYVQNIAFDAQQVAALSGRSTNDMQDDAYEAGILVGYPQPRQCWQWNLFGYYKYVGTDSVVDAFNDTDFHLGGTNAKGWVFGAQLGIMKNVWLTARWLTADQISPFQNSTGPFSVDVFQFDTNAAF